MKLVPVMMRKLTRVGTYQIKADMYLGRVNEVVAQGLMDRGIINILTTEEAKEEEKKKRGA